MDINGQIDEQIQDRVHLKNIGLTIKNVLILWR
jgi:hypothetical protein